MASGHGWTSEFSLARAAWCRGVHPETVRALGPAPAFRQRVTSTTPACRNDIVRQSAWETPAAKRGAAVINPARHRQSPTRNDRTRRAAAELLPGLLRPKNVKQIAIIFPTSRYHPLRSGKAPGELPMSLEAGTETKPVPLSPAEALEPRFGSRIERHIIRTKPPGGASHRGNALHRAHHGALAHGLPLPSGAIRPVFAWVSAVRHEINRAAQPGCPISAEPSMAIAANWTNHTTCCQQEQLCVLK